MRFWSNNLTINTVSIKEEQMKSSLLLGLSAFVFCSTAYASDFYVNTNGNGSECTEQAPCPSIQSAVNIANANDTIKISSGVYHENITIPVGKNGLTLKGKGADSTIIISSGADITPKFAPAGIPADIILDIFSADVTIEGLATLHPAADATKRDIGIFVRPPATNVTIKKCKLQRNRTGNLEPFTPGSRGILVFRATGTKIIKNELSGNYQDHLHIPASNTLISKNEIKGATRIGIVIIQENESSDSTNNIITKNEVEDSGTDGIQIQGDNNFISKNELENNAAAGIRLCGIGDCVAPGINAIADSNTVNKNEYEDNAVDLANNGSNTIFK